MASTAEQDAWLAEVVGLTLPPGGVSDVASRTGLEGLKGLSSLWERVEAHVISDIEKLGQAIVGLYEDDEKEKAKQVEDAYEAHVRGILDTFDGTILGALNAVAACMSQEAAAQQIVALRQSTQGCLSFVATDPVIAMIDGNPIMAIAVAQTCTDALTQILAALDAADKAAS